MCQNETHSKRHEKTVPMKNGTSKNKPNSKPRRNKCDLGADFVAPDGGWGWAVLIAAGCSNVRNN